MLPEQAPDIRPYHAGDGPRVRSLAAAEIERSSYRSGPGAAIDGVVRGSDPDTHCLVAVHEGAVVAFAIYGTIAGSEGAGRLQLLVTDPPFRRTGIARRLVETAVEHLRETGARFTLVEIPEDPALGGAINLLGQCGFHLEARISGFYRDDVDLALFRRELSAG